MSDSVFLPELADFSWAGREVAIAYDSDVVEKPRVRDAEQRLCREIGQRGAEIRAVRLPDGEDGEKVGLDDFLATHGADAFAELAVATELVPRAYDLPVSIRSLMARDYPDTEWILDEFVLKGEVNLLYGDGGVGKSLLALHLAVAVANGDKKFGRAVSHMPVIALFAEDGEAEVQRRLETILIESGIEPKPDLPLSFWCRPSEDTLLAIVSDEGEVREQPRLQAIRAELEKIGVPALVILDSLADLFAFNESLRLPVNAAMKRVLGSLCRDYDATVLVLGHPSKTAMLDGSHYSGSTAFNNAVRHRLTLEIAKQENGMIVEGPPPRVLKVAKSNYGAPAEMTLWFYGATIDELPRASASSAEDTREAVLATMLDLIDRGIRVVNRNGNAGDARTLSDVAKTIAERRGTKVHWKLVKDHLRRFVDEGVLRYRESDKTVRPHVKAGYERGNKCRH